MRMVNLGLGSPALPAPALAKARFSAVMNEDDGGLGYAPGNGEQEARETVAWWLEQQFGVQGLNPGKCYDGRPETVGNVTFGEGSRLLLVSALEAFFRPGDEIFLPARYYNGYWDAAKKFGLKPLLVPSQTAAEFVSGLETLLRTCKLPKVVVPPCSNPDGISCGAAEYGKLVSLAHDYGFLILDDYAYGSLDYRQGYVPCSLSVPGALDVVLWFGTASKMFSAASWKVGFAVGRQDRIAALTSVKSIYSEGGSRPGQLALATGLKAGDSVIAPTRNCYARRAELTTDLLKQAGMSQSVSPERGMFGWYEVVGYTGGSVRLATELKARGVIVRDDRLYGGNGSHIRWCYRVQDEDTHYACEQVADLLKIG